MAADARKKAQRRDLQILAVLVAAAVVLVGVIVYQNSGGNTANGAAPPPNPQQAALAQLAHRQPDDPLAIGRADASVVMIEYSDYRCPFCAKFSRDVEPELIKRYVDRGVLRIEWRDFAIFGDESVAGARAGRAAAEQGKFWEFNRTVFEQAPESGHPPLPPQRLVELAQQARVPDIGRFQADMNDPRTLAAVRRDTSEASNIGATSTPTFLINGQPLLGAQPLTEFTNAIDQAAGAN